MEAAGGEWMYTHETSDLPHTSRSPPSNSTDTYDYSDTTTSPTDTTYTYPYRQH